MNSVQIIGNLGDDPELNQTKSGRSVCNLSVATNRKWTDNNGNKKQDTTWHDVTVWGKQAESCAQYLSKGRQVAVEGRIQKDEYTDRNGVDRTAFKIVAHRVHFLSDGNGGSRGNRQPKQQPSPGNPARQQQQQPQQNQGGGWPNDNQQSQGSGWPDGDNQRTDSYDDDSIPF